MNELKPCLFCEEIPQYIENFKNDGDPNRYIACPKCNTRSISTCNYTNWDDSIKQWNKKYELLKSFKDFIYNQKPMSAEAKQAIKEHFWELLS